MKIYKAIIYIAIILVALFGVIYYFNKFKMAPIQVTDNNSVDQRLELKHPNAHLGGIYSVKGNKQMPKGKIRFSYNATYRNIKLDLDNKQANGSVPLTGDLNLILNNYVYLDGNVLANVENKDKNFKLQGYLWPEEKIIDISIVPAEKDQIVTAQMPDKTKENYKISDFYLSKTKYKEIYNIQETDAFLLEAPPGDIIPSGMSDLKTVGQLYFINK